MIYSQPKLIYTIIAFFAQIECFKYFTDDEFETSKNDLIITKIDILNECRTVYGSKIIPFNSFGIHEWKIKVIQGTFISIGIDEASHSQLNEAYFDMEGSLHYSYIAYGGAFYDVQEQTEKFLDSFGSGDTVTMNLNMNNKTISFALNDGALKQGCVIKESKVGYSLEIFLRYKGARFEILSYTWTRE